MDKKALEYCFRGIIQLFNEDKDKFNDYIEQAMGNSTECNCRTSLIRVKYMGQAAILCTSCGQITIDGEVVRHCSISSRKVS